VSSIALLLLSVLVRPPSPPHQLTATERGTLRGIRTASVVVEDLSSVSQQCGASEESLKLAAARPLVDARIPVRDKLDDVDVVIYVNLTSLTIDAETMCAAALHVEAETYGQAQLQYQAQPVFSRIQLWARDNVMTLLRMNFKKTVDDKVKEVVDEFVTKVKLANQK
jgi:hypothetical protein